MKENLYQSCILLRDVMLFKFMPRSLTSRLITLPTCDLKHTIQSRPSHILSVRFRTLAGTFYLKARSVNRIRPALTSNASQIIVHNNCVVRGISRIWGQLWGAHTIAVALTITVTMMMMIMMMMVIIIAKKVHEIYSSLLNISAVFAFASNLFCGNCLCALDSSSHHGARMNYDDGLVWMVRSCIKIAPLHTTGSVISVQYGPLFLHILLECMLLQQLQNQQPRNYAFTTAHGQNFMKCGECRSDADFFLSSPLTIQSERACCGGGAPVAN